MAWHILKKDLRLLWVLALVVAAIHLTAAVLRSRLGLFQEPSQLAVIANLLSLASLLGIVVLAIAVMHQDPVPGVRQDWLIRPIRRSDLVFAKLLFVMLVVQGPLLLADLSEGLMDGFTFPASLGSAAARDAAILCFLSLPAVMIGTVTRNVMESFIIAIVGLIFAVLFLVGVVLLLGVKTTVGGTGLAWVIGATWYILAAAGTAVVISLQFFRRKTTMARCLVGAGAAAIILSSFLPWRTAFALQEHLSKEPAAANAIMLAFNPQQGRFKLPPGAAAATSTALYVPLHVTGVPSATIMLLDRAYIRITDISGRTLYESRSNLSVDGVGSIQDARFEVQQSKDDAAADIYQRIFVPAAVYTKLRNQPVGLAIDFSLTLFRAAATYSLPATGENGRLAGLGWCATRVDGEGDDVQLRCMNTGHVPTCFSAFLEHSPSGLRNPETHVCDPDYTPFGANLWPDALARFAGEIPFYDRSGLVHYPVDGTKLADAHLVIATYEPRDHFVRQLNISNVRLSDFAGPLAASSAHF